MPLAAPESDAKDSNCDVRHRAPIGLVDSRSLIGLVRDVLSNDNQLALLFITRMVGMVAQQAQLPSGGDQQATDDNQPRGASEPLCKLLQSARDAMQVTMRYILHCKSLRIPDLPDPFSSSAGLEWIAAAKTVLDQTFARSRSSTFESKCALFETERAAQCEEKMSAVARLLKKFSQCMKMQGDLQNLWYAVMYGPIWAELSGLRVEAPPHLFQCFFDALDREGLPALHSAVHADDMDVVELLLLLGASPLARVPLADGTEVPWLHGIANQSSQPCFELLSRAQKVSLFSDFKPRAAAWQPTLLVDKVPDMPLPADGDDRGENFYENLNEHSDEDGETVEAEVPCWVQTTARMGTDGQKIAPSALALAPDPRLGSTALQPPMSELPEDVNLGSFAEVCPCIVPWLKQSHEHLFAVRTKQCA
jgi:hypothetical protein